VSSKRSSYCSLVVMISTLVAGCGPTKPSIVPVLGEVLLDGRPVERASVMFIPVFQGGLPSVGVTDAAGKFTLKTANVGDGAIPGKYSVTIAKVDVTGVLADRTGLAGDIAPGGLHKRWIVPERYANPATSSLSVDVRRTMAPQRLELTSR
jgi:hypothetical protein